MELGVKEIGVFSSEFSSAYMSENKLERLQKVAKEAAKQCLRAVAPKITYYPTLADTLSAGKNYENRIFACEFAQKSDVELSTLRGSTAIIIGSEGGFSQEEATLAKQNGYQFITLGKRILRAETAAVSVVAVTAYSLGEWQ